MKKRPTIKEVLAKKDSFMEVMLSYSTLILPYEDGIKFMESLRNAEQKITPKGGGYDEYTIVPIQEKPSTRPISQKEYLDMKMAHLLGVTVKELNAEPDPASTEPD